MPRAVDGTRRKDRRKKILKQAKGFRGKSGKLFRQAKDAITKAGTNAYKDRRRKKRDFRRLWISRISSVCRLEGISYSQFMNKLKKSNVLINRKALSNLAIEDYQAFKAIVENVKSA